MATTDARGPKVPKRNRTVTRLEIIGNILSAWPSDALSSCHSLRDLDVTVPGSGVGWLRSLSGSTFIASLSTLTELRSLRFDNRASSERLSLFSLHGMSSLTRLDLPQGIELSEVARLPSGLTDLGTAVHCDPDGTRSISDTTKQLLSLLRRPLVTLTISSALLRLLLAINGRERSSACHTLTKLVVSGSVTDSEPTSYSLANLDRLCPSLVALDVSVWLNSTTMAAHVISLAQQPVAPQLLTSLHSFKHDEVASLTRSIITGDRKVENHRDEIEEEQEEESKSRVINAPIFSCLRHMTFRSQVLSTALQVAPPIVPGYVHALFATPYFSAANVAELCLPACDLVASDLLRIARVPNLQPKLLDLSDNTTLYNLEVLAAVEQAPFVASLETLLLKGCESLGAHPPSEFPETKTFDDARRVDKEKRLTILEEVMTDPLHFLVSSNFNKLHHLDLSACSGIRDISRLGFAGALTSLTTLKLNGCAAIGRHMFLPARGSLPNLRSLDLLDVPIVTTPLRLKARFPRLSNVRFGRTPLSFSSRDIIQTAAWTYRAGVPFIICIPTPTSTLDTTILLRGDE
jgi:hypothetical protein